MASPPMIPANAPDWIKGWAKENAEFVSSFNAPSASEASRVAEAPVLKQDAVPFTNSRSFSEVSSVPRDPAYHYAPTTPPAAETASGISPDTDTIGQLGGPHKDFVEPVAHNPDVAWVAAEDQLCDDAKVRLSAKEPDVLTLRARTWNCEMDNIFSPRRPDLISTGGEPSATHHDKLLVEHINHQRQAHFDKASASRGPTTISEYAKRVAQDNPNDWAEYLQAYRQKFLEPDMFALDYAKNVELARDLLTHVLRDRVKIICCTPIALEQIVSHTGLQGDFVAIDEAHRMTEAMSAVVMSKCPRASFLLMGDTEQSNPQGPTSLLGRMERAGATLYHLKSNYRSG
ncbi:mfs monocarboxylate transporter [Fusarium flagelliforme]|uniref:Mfs monocarboxylate transporter n=1 Tax=Fusarium flagelliforme TaxID=2675880 RepID=A0A395MF67_9HYPO|nr:mfs monocarboxylate transporter [Fusarium flagelliforme]